MAAPRLASSLEPIALGAALAAPLAMLALAPGGPALLLLVLTATVPAILLYGLYRVAVRGRPAPARRPALVPPALGPAPAEIRAAPFRVVRRGHLVLEGTLDDVVRAAREGDVDPFDLVAGAGVEAAPADLADLVAFVPSRAEARARRGYLVYLAVSLAAGGLGVAVVAALRLAGAPLDGDTALGVLVFALALAPLPLMRREWRRLERGREAGLVPEPPPRRTLGSAPLDAAVAGPTPATRVVLGLVVAVSVLALLLPEEVLQLRLAKDNEAIRAGEVWRLVTAGLVHGGAIHLLINASVLSDLGRVVERLLGSRRMLAVLWGGVAAGSLASFLTNPHLSVGVSGGLFALVGALLAVGLRHRRSLPPAARRMLVRAPITVIVLNVALGLALPFIDNAAHLGGLAAGVLLGFVSGLRPELAAALGRPAPGSGR